MRPELADMRRRVACMLVAGRPWIEAPAPVAAGESGRSSSGPRRGTRERRPVTADAEESSES